MRFFRRLWAAFPLSLAGLVLVVLGGWTVWWQGIGKGDLVLLMVALSAGSVLLVLLASSVATALYLRGRLRALSTAAGVPLELEGEMWQPTDFELPVPGWVPFLDVDWSWEDREVEVRCRGTASQALELVRPLRRGTRDRVARLVRVGDVFKLTSIVLRFEQSRPVTILPGMGSIDRLSLLSRFVTGEDLSDPRGDPTGDRVDMRQYARGDSPRTILWKVYARTRKLMVRVPERAVTARPRACAYMVAGAGDEAGAGVARVVLQRELLGEGWRFGADGTPGFTENREEALVRLARSGNPESAAVPCGLADFLQEAAQSGFSACFVFVPCGTREQEVLEAVQSSSLRAILCMGLDHILLQSTRRAIRWRRLLYHRGEEGATVEDLERISDTWGRAGCELLLVDRIGGGLYTDLEAVIQAWRRAS